MEQETKRKGVEKKIFLDVCQGNNRRKIQGYGWPIGVKDTQANANLANYPTKLWCKAFMKIEVKCDSVDNNMCETFNGILALSKQEHKSIIKM